MGLFRKRKRETIGKKAIEHSSLGEFTKGDSKHPPRLKSGGHGEENIKELNKRGIAYNIIKLYPNGVRLGNVPTHKEANKRVNDGQVWFPRDWNRRTIKKAGEKIINSKHEKVDDGATIYGIYGKVSVGVKKQEGKVKTVFPNYKQSGGKNKNGNKK